MHYLNRRGLDLYSLDLYSLDLYSLDLHGLNLHGQSTPCKPVGAERRLR